MALHKDRYTSGWATKCPDSLHHSPPNGKGKCEWCGRKIATAMPAPDPTGFVSSDLTEAYNEYYDPDHGALTRDQIRRKYEMGQNP